jgi:transketolase
LSAPSTTAPEPPAIEDLRRRASGIRRRVLEQASGRGEGYVAQGLQCADVFATLFFSELDVFDRAHDDPDRDRFLLSVGHYAIALYAVLVEAGVLDPTLLPSYGEDGSVLTLGAEPGVLPGIEFAGGSLAQGLGVGAGLAWGLRRRGGSGRAVVYVSDGELQEGSTWEAAMFAGHHGLSNLLAVIDVNRTQADGALVLEVEPVTAKFRAFGWWAVDVDGHDIDALCAAFAEARREQERPTALVVHTTLGKGSPTLEQRPRAHFVRVRPDEWPTIADEVASG